jgi:hypothetical protein
MGLDTKTYWLTDRQSQRNFDFDSSVIAVQDKVKPDIENIRGLNLTMVKLTTDQVTRQPLQHKICKMGMICPAKTILTEDLCVVQKQKFFYNMLYVRNVHLTKGQAYL